MVKAVTETLANKLDEAPDSLNATDPLLVVIQSSGVAEAVAHLVGAVVIILGTDHVRECSLTDARGDLVHKGSLGQNTKPVKTEPKWKRQSAEIINELFNR